jgi:hypothetical protein
MQEVAKPSGQRWGWTIITLLSVQLGWGLWLMCAIRFLYTTSFWAAMACAQANGA